MPDKLTGTNLVDKIVPFTALDKFPTHEDIYGAGGYVTLSGYPTAYETLTAGTGVPYADGYGRQKVGQIIYDQQTGHSFQVKSTGYRLSGSKLIKTSPYEYSSWLPSSTNIVAKNSQNTIQNSIGSIIAGTTMEVEAFNYSAILAGTQNSISYPPYYSLIDYYTSQCSLIVGGSGNSIPGYANFSSIVGGNKQSISQSHFSLIGGGQYNTVYNSSYSLIMGGKYNTIGKLANTAYYSNIVGGSGNLLAGEYSNIVGGFKNTSLKSYTFIGGGSNNRVGGQGDIILGGTSNTTSQQGDEGTLIYTKKIDNVDPTYALRSKLLKFTSANSTGVLAELLPGSNTPGQAAGIINLYQDDQTYADAASGRQIKQTITSDSPSVNGLYGHTLYSYHRNGNIDLVAVGEPGNKKVHIYHMDVTNASAPLTALQVIDHSTGPYYPSEEFGYSLNICTTNFAGNTASPYLLLFVGAPGYSTVYVYKTDVIDPTVQGTTPNFTLIDTILGQSNSRFGESIVSTGFSNTSWPISGVIVGIGAPDQETKYGKTGAVNFYGTTLGHGYSADNRVFETFTPLFSSSCRFNNFYTGQEYGKVLYEGDRYGESFVQGLTLRTREKGTSDASALQSLAIPTSSFNPYALSSYWVFTYIAAPKKSLLMSFKRDSDDVSKVLADTVNYYYEEPLSRATGFEYVSCFQVGWYTGIWSMLSANDTGEKISIEGSYGQFSILGQSGYNQSEFIYGPSRSADGVYALNAVLSSTSNYTRKNTNEFGSSHSYGRYTIGASSNYVTSTDTIHPGFVDYFDSTVNPGFTQVLAPYPSSNFNEITSYGLARYRWESNINRSGIATFYYLSGANADLHYSTFSLDIPGEGTSESNILGGIGNTLKSRYSSVFGGDYNTIDILNVRSTIIGGSHNLIYNNTGTGTAVQYQFIGTGDTNIIYGSKHATILNGKNNIIRTKASYSVILGGENNLILPSVTNSYILGSNIVASQSNTTYLENVSAQSLVVNSLTALSSYAVNTYSVVNNLTGLYVTGSIFASGGFTTASDISAKALYLDLYHAPGEYAHTILDAYTDYTTNLTYPRLRFETQLGNVDVLNMAGVFSVRAPISAHSVSISAVKFTGEVKSTPATVTDANKYIQVIVEGQIKYIRLYDLT